MRERESWQPATAAVWGGAAVAYLLATVMLFLARVLPPWQWALLAVAAYGGITLVLRQTLAQRRGVLEKVFGVPGETAGEVVENVLREKGLPFRPGGQAEERWFDVGEEVAIIVQPLVTRAGFQASRIQIRPVTAETRPLVESLTAKLDEAFAPRGAGGRS